MSILKQTDIEIRRYLSSVKLSEICRTCLARRPKMNNINSPIADEKYESSGVNIITILRHTLNATPVNQFPDKICSPCTRRLLRTHLMHQQCLQADRMLREISSAVCVKAENSEDEGDVAERIFTGETGWDDAIEEQSKSDDVRTSFSNLDVKFESRISDLSAAPESADNRSVVDSIDRHSAGLYSAPMDGDKRKKRAMKKIKLKDDAVESSFVCDECGKIFAKKRTLAAHTRTIHSAAARPVAKTYVCATCNKQFTNGTSLRIHHKMHLGIKEAMCDVCGVRMRHGGALTRHLRSHGATPSRYECAVCGRRYRSAQALREHSTKHTGEKQATCTVCGLRVAHSGRLRWHMRRHSASSRVECGRCGRTFCSPAALRQHGLLHDSERPYLCDTCGHAFAHPKTLRNHKKTHDKTKRSETIKAKGDAEKKIEDSTENVAFENEYGGSDLVANA